MGSLRTGPMGGANWVGHKEGIRQHPTLCSRAALSFVDKCDFETFLFAHLFMLFPLKQLKKMVNFIF